MRLVPGAHALPSPPAPPAPAQPHDRQLHVGAPAPPHRPDVGPPPPSPPPAAPPPPPGLQRAGPPLQLHRLSGLQRADGGLRLEAQLQRLRLFGLQRPGLVAFPSAVTFLSAAGAFILKISVETFQGESLKKKVTRCLSSRFSSDLVGGSATPPGLFFYSRTQQSDPGSSSADLERQSVGQSCCSGSDQSTPS